MKKTQKTIAFLNRSWEQISLSFIKLKAKFKNFIISLECNSIKGMYSGFFILQKKNKKITINNYSFLDM